LLPAGEKEEEEAVVAYWGAAGAAVMVPGGTEMVALPGPPVVAGVGAVQTFYFFMGLGLDACIYIPKTLPKKLKICC
jgi:hypothetical protein